MKNKITDVTVVEHLLSKYSIVEMNDESQKNALVATLLNGEKRWIELEKTIIPAEAVGRYLVVEHTFPTPGIPSAKHFAEPIGTYNNYIDAQKEFYLKATKMSLDAREEDDFKEILLVGEFKSRKLDFDYMGKPDINTGITMASALTKYDPYVLKGYVALDPVDPNEALTLKTKLYVQLDRESATLKFEQHFFAGEGLDVRFWQVDRKMQSKVQGKNSGGDEDNLITKNKVPKTNHKDFTTEQWVNDSLLSKRPGSKGKTNGNGIN